MIKKREGLAKFGEHRKVKQIISAGNSHVACITEDGLFCVYDIESKSWIVPNTETLPR